MSRIPVALSCAAVAAAAAVALTACAGPTTPAASNGPAAGTAQACTALPAFDRAATTYPGGDPGAPPPTPDAVKQWAATAQPHFDLVAGGVPVELGQSVATLRSALAGAADGVPINADDTALTDATNAIDRWAYDNCGFIKVGVQATGSELTGLPASLPEGPAALAFTNTGPPEQAGFVLLVAKVRDGQTVTLDQVRSPEIDFASIDIVAAIQPTPATPTGYGTASLTSGRYLVLSPIGAPPSFGGMLAAEFTVA